MAWSYLTQIDTPVLVSVIALTNYTLIVWPVSESDGKGRTGLYDCCGPIRERHEAWSGPVRERHRGREREKRQRGGG